MMLPEIFDQVRREYGFMTVNQLAELCVNGNNILDPFSTLISVHIKIGKGNVFYPGTILSSTELYPLEIGDRNIFHSNTLIEASGGPVRIGSENQFGEGGVTLKANREGACIEIGNNGRYLGGASVFGTSSLGSGSQILGAITVDSCQLIKGSSWKDAGPDTRGGLLKGFGTAKNLTVETGHVINGSGMFSESMTEHQSKYHPAIQNPAR